MSLFQAYAETMRSQERNGQPQEYTIPAELLRRIRILLANTDDTDQEADFLLDNLKSERGAPAVIHTFIAHHLYEYLQGAAR